MWIIHSKITYDLTQYCARWGRNIKSKKKTKKKMERYSLQGRVWQWIRAAVLGRVVLMDLENFKFPLLIFESKIALATTIFDTVASKLSDLNDSMVIIAIEIAIYLSKRTYAASISSSGHFQRCKCNKEGMGKDELDQPSSRNWLRAHSPSAPFFPLLLQLLEVILVLLTEREWIECTPDLSRNDCSDVAKLNNFPSFPSQTGWCNRVFQWGEVRSLFTCALSLRMILFLKNIFSIFDTKTA